MAFLVSKLCRPARGCIAFKNGPKTSFIIPCSANFAVKEKTGHIYFWEAVKEIWLQLIDLHASFSPNIDAIVWTGSNYSFYSLIFAGRQ